MRVLVNFVFLFITLEQVQCTVDVNDERRAQLNPRRMHGEPNVPGPRRVQPRPRSPERRLPSQNNKKNHIPIDVVERLQDIRSTTDFLKAFGGEKFIVKKPERKELKGVGGLPGPIRGSKETATKEEVSRQIGEDSIEDFENQYCSPRPTIVHVEQPEDYTGFVFPFCIKLKRCTGCCNVGDNIQHCAPVAVGNVTFTGYKVTWAAPQLTKKSVLRVAGMSLGEIQSALATKDQLATQGGRKYHVDEDDDHDDNYDYDHGDKNHSEERQFREPEKKDGIQRRTRRQARMTSQRIEEIAITMASHTQCGCVCTLDPSKCNPRQHFVRRHCRCECIKREECKGPFQWDDQECKCVCTQKLDACKSTMYWDRNTCACKCWRRSCKRGKVQDPKTCRCVNSKNRRRSKRRKL